MKKILILTAIILLTQSTYTYSACKIEDLGACQANIGAGINDKLNDKIIPNNLDAIVKPNNTFNSRTQLGQPNVPENVNMEPAQEESTQPYDANCQFGNCINRTNAGSKGNNR